MSPIKNVVISAAGIGSRLGLNRSKCLIEVAGKTLLSYHLERLSDVENVWVVVGFQEEDVIEEAIKIRPDCIIVRNPDYMKTNTLQSIWRVSKHLKERFLIIDADTLIEDESFNKFMAATSDFEHLIGVSSFTTSDGVRVNVDSQGMNVTGFTRDTSFNLEWTGIAIIGTNMVVNEQIFVYQSLNDFLPIPLCNINAFDIDTIQDLDMAKKIMNDGWRNNAFIN
ncbi:MULTISPECIES: NTP transferase domain-containing protein [Erwinia]|uniref:NTP transferase domain-containing protein n=1 Tax=Erwinia TaxID=551 RepID=UPI00054E5787|nr:MULTISPECIES: NTP transferase domain-containing protein [Erwinia]